MPAHSVRTEVFAQRGELDLELDIYEPDAGSSGPAVLFWHGGGLATGDRTNFVPQWLVSDALAQGWTFVSADYRLIPPGSAAELLEDALAAYAHVQQLPNVDGRIIVSGNSAGGYLAQLVALHAEQKPAGILLMYALGLDLLSPHWRDPTTDPELLEHSLPEMSESDRKTFDPPACFDLPSIPGWPCPVDSPVDARRRLYLHYMRHGIWLDVIFRQPGLSAKLRSGPSRQVLTPQQRALVPSLWPATSFPPTYMLHGQRDIVVPVEDSRQLLRRLQVAGVEVKLVEAAGEGHSFDLDEANLGYTTEVVPWFKRVMAGTWKRMY